ncbi:MAG: DedA family protein, partial [Sciscionella sp.]
GRRARCRRRRTASAGFRRTGRSFIIRRGGRILNLERLRRAERFLNRHGWWAVLLARWIPWIRTLAPMIAGAARMNRRRYLVATSVGAALWVPALVLIGYYGAGLLDALPWLKHVATWTTVGCFVLGTGYGLFRYVQEMRKPRERHEIGVHAND